MEAKVDLSPRSIVPFAGHRPTQMVICKGHRGFDRKKTKKGREIQRIDLFFKDNNMVIKKKRAQNFDN